MQLILQISSSSLNLLLAIYIVFNMIYCICIIAYYIISIYNICVCVIYIYFNHLPPVCLPSAPVQFIARRT